MIDIYEYLKMDHQKVDNLFKQFDDSKNEQRKKEIVALITKELMVHAHSEQETFYKVLAQFPESSDSALHGAKEHGDIEAQIQKINQSKGKEWELAVLTLKELVQHHVKEEEGEVFKKAKKVLSKEQAIELKEKMHYLKGCFLIWLDKKQNEPLKEKAS